MPGRLWRRSVPLVLLLYLPLALHAPHHQNIKDETSVGSSTETSAGHSDETSHVLLSVASESSPLHEPSVASESSPPHEPSVASEPPSTTTTTALPTLSEEHLFQRTDTLLTNITASLDDLLEVVGGSEAAARSFMKRRPSRHSSGASHPKDRSSNFCTGANALCTSLYNTLNDAQHLVDILVNDTKTWDEVKLFELQRNSEELQNLTTEAEASSDFLGSVDTEPFQEFVLNTKNAVAAGQQVAREIVRSIQRGERDSVILMAVMGAVGGVLMVIPVVGVALICCGSSRGRRGSRGLRSSPDPITVRGGTRPGAALVSGTSQEDLPARPYPATLAASHLTSNVYGPSRAPGSSRSYSPRRGLKNEGHSHLDVPAATRGHRMY